MALPVGASSEFAQAPRKIGEILPHLLEREADGEHALDVVS